jgi:hypothetical protein
MPIWALVTLLFAGFRLMGRAQIRQASMKTNLPTVRRWWDRQATGGVVLTLPGLARGREMQVTTRANRAMEQG